MMLFDLLSVADNSKLDWAHNYRYLFLIIPVLGVLIYLMYKKERELDNAKKRNFLIAMRLIALSILLVLFFEPRKVTTTIEDIKSPFLIFVDKSMSMNTKGEEYDKKERARFAEKFGADVIKMTRFEQQKKCAIELQELLKETHNVKIVGFGDSFSYFSDKVSWDGTQLDKRTRLNESVRLAMSEIRGESVSGIVVMTDGNVEDAESTKRFLDKMKEVGHTNMKVSTLGFGSEVVKPDVKLLSFSIPEVVIKSKDTVTFRATFSARGVDPKEEITLKLFRNNELMKDQIKKVALEKGEVEFEVVLNTAGKFTYRLEIEPVKDEGMKDNNKRTAFVTVKDEKLKILYVDDFPRHDYRKLTQFFERNDNLYESRIWLNQAQQLYKQRGSDPLKQSPVNTYIDFDKLWKEVDVIFLGNIGYRAFRGSYFLEHLEEFVAKGGGLVFLAGPYNMPSSYIDGEYVKKLLPVILGSQAGGKADMSKSPFNFKVTNRGSRHPVTRMGPPEVTKRAWEKGLPRCQWFYRPAGLKPSAYTLIEHPEEECSSEKTNVPIFAGMPYGKGQTFWLGTDEMSRWSFLDNDEYMFNHFIGQLVQYMSSSKVRAGGLLEVDMDQIPLGDEVTVTMRLDDPSETSEQKKTVKWAYGNENEQVLELTRRSENSIIFEGKLLPKKKGIVNIWLKDKVNSQQVSVTGFSRELEANEMNRSNLQLLSDDGALLPLTGIQDLAKTFSENQETKQKQTTESFLDSNKGTNSKKKQLIIAILVILSLVLGLEWWLRKRWHLL